MQMTKTKYTHINTNESTHSEMDPVRQNPIQSWTDWQSWSFFFALQFFLLIRGAFVVTKLTSDSAAIGLHLSKWRPKRRGFPLRS